MFKNVPEPELAKRVNPLAFKKPVPPVPPILVVPTK